MQETGRGPLRSPPRCGTLGENRKRGFCHERSGIFRNRQYGRRPGPGGLPVHRAGSGDSLQPHPGEGGGPGRGAGLHGGPGQPGGRPVRPLPLPGGEAPSDAGPSGGDRPGSLPRPGPGVHGGGTHPGDAGRVGPRRNGRPADHAQHPLRHWKGAGGPVRRPRSGRGARPGGGEDPVRGRAGRAGRRAALRRLFGGGRMQSRVYLSLFGGPGRRRRAGRAPAEAGRRLCCSGYGRLRRPGAGERRTSRRAQGRGVLPRRLHHRGRGRSGAPRLPGRGNRRGGGGLE